MKSQRMEWRKSVVKMMRELNIWIQFWVSFPTFCSVYLFVSAQNQQTSARVQVEDLQRSDRTMSSARQRTFLRRSKRWAFSATGFFFIAKNELNTDNIRRRFQFVIIFLLHLARFFVVLVNISRMKKCDGRGPRESRLCKRPRKRWEKL